MLADHQVADTHLAHAAVHVIDEQLGQQHRIVACLIPVVLQPQQYQRENRGDHVETAVERVRHLTFAIPGGVARLGDEGGVERAKARSEEHTSELQSLMRISYAVFCLKKKNKTKTDGNTQRPAIVENK